MKQILLVYILLHSIIISNAVAQKNNYGHLKLGVQSSANVGAALIDVTNDGYKYGPQLTYRSNNGFSIQPYLKFHKRAFVLQAAIGYGINFNHIHIKHETNPVKYNFASHHLLYELQMGFLINRKNPNHLELGFGWSFAQYLDRQVKFKMDYTSVYDPALGHQNNIPLSAFRSSADHYLRFGFLTYLQYNYNTARYPWYIKFMVNLGLTYPTHSVGIKHFDPKENRKIIGHYLLTPNNDQFIVSFGLQLFERSKAKMKID